MPYPACARNPDEDQVPPARKRLALLAFLIAILTVAIIVWATNSSDTPNQQTPTDATTPSRTPTQPPPAASAGVMLSQMAISATPITVQLPAGAQLKTADPLTPLVTVDLSGRTEVSDRFEFTSRVFELRGNELVELAQLEQLLRETFAESDGAVTCDMDAYGGIVLAHCELPVRAEVVVVVFDTKTGHSFRIEDEGLLAATTLSADSHVAIAAPARPPGTPPAITVTHYAGDGTVRWSEDLVLADEWTLTDVAAQLPSWRLPPAHLALPTVTGGGQTNWKVLDLQRHELSALPASEGEPRIVNWPGEGALLVSCGQDGPTRPQLLDVAFQETGDASASLHVLAGIGAPLGLQWCEDGVESPVPNAFMRAATAVPFADLQAALASAATLPPPAGERFVMQILPGGQMLSAPVGGADAALQAELPPAFAAVSATCDVPSILVEEQTTLLCIANDAGARTLLGYEADRRTPLFSLPLDDGVSPFWVRVGSDTWALSAGEMLVILG